MTPTSYQQLVAWLDQHLRVRGSEHVASRAATGRVLAAGIRAAADLPAAPAAALDGYALHAAATLGAGDYNPLPLRITAADGGPLAAHAAAPVLSGAPLPPGADAVLRIEDAERRGDTLDLHTPLAAGENIVPAGREARAGDTLFAAGHRLRPTDTALCLALGRATLTVVQQPRVSILTLRPWASGASDALVEALAARDGARCLAAAAADREALTGALDTCRDDLAIVIGGSGPGDNDFAASVLATRGTLVFRGVAISPGETTSVGWLGERLVVVLPGPPLAAFFAYELVAGRALRCLAGLDLAPPYATRSARLAGKIASALGRLECARVRLSGDQARPIAVADARTLSTLTRSDGFVLVPEHSEGFAEGAPVTVYQHGGPVDGSAPACLNEPGK